MDHLYSSRALMGLLWAATGRERLPVHAWVFEAAVERLAQMVSGGSIGTALVRLASPTKRADQKYSRVEAVLRELADAGFLHPEGQGWEATYRASRPWREAHEGMLESLPEAEWTAFQGAGQLLIAMSTIVEKKRAA